MSLLPIPSGTSSNVAGGFYPYTIDGSLRFNMQDSPDLTRTMGTATDGTKCTISFWIKKNRSSNSTTTARFMSAYSGTGNQFHMQWGDGTTSPGDQWNVSPGEQSSQQGIRMTDATLRDPSAWYHCVWSYNSTSGSESVVLYVNGVAQTSSTYTGAPTTNLVTSATKSGTTLDIGYVNSSSFDIQLAEMHLIDGQALDPDDFGQEKNGVWIPKAYSGTYGDNGFYLKFDGNANDSSGNGNNFTANNIGSWDYIPDSPTNNFCTLNPLQSTKSATLREGNLELLNGSNDQGSVGTFGITSGKWYWEVYYPTNDCPEVGVMPIDQNLSGRSTVGSGNVDGLARITNGTSMRSVSFATVDNTGLTTQTSFGTVRVVLDADNGKLWVSDNDGTYPNSGNPVTGTNPQATFDSDWVFQTEGVYPFALVATGSSQFCLFNFGQDSTFTDQKSSGGYSDENGYGDFSYAVPDGYLALCTANLSVTEKIDLAQDGTPEDYFGVDTYAGTSGTHERSALQFQPDFVWTKNRTNTTDHQLVDASRGNTKALRTNQVDSEDTFTNGILSFDPDGVTLGDNNRYNQTGYNYVSWNWRANGAGTSVTFPTTGGSGSISGTRSVDADIGFSLITYTAASSDPGQTRIEHGLGVAPKFHLIKCRSASSNGSVYHYKNGTGNMQIVNTNGYDSGWNGYDGAHPNSTYIALNWQTQASGAYRDVNEQSRDYVMYAFAEVEGFSKIGMYTDAVVDDYTTDSPFVYCGFRPAWIMIKSTSSGRHWIVADNKRNTSNVITDYLRPNKDSTTYTVSTLLMDFMANGFKVRGGSGEINTTNENYIFIAFAENPFKYANAR